MRLVCPGGAAGLILDSPAAGMSPAVLEIGAGSTALRQRNGKAAAVPEEYLAADAVSWAPAISGNRDHPPLCPQPQHGKTRG